MRVVVQVVALDFIENGPLLSTIEGMYSTRIAETLPQDYVIKVMFVLEPDVEDSDSGHHWSVRGITPDGNTWLTEDEVFGLPHLDPGLPYQCVLIREIGFRARRYGIYEFHLVWDGEDFGLARLEIARCPDPTGQ